MHPQDEDEHGSIIEKPWFISSFLMLSRIAHNEIYNHAGQNIDRNHALNAGIGVKLVGIKLVGIRQSRTGARHVRHHINLRVYPIFLIHHQAAFAPAIQDRQSNLGLNS